MVTNGPVASQCLQQMNKPCLVMLHCWLLFVCIQVVTVHVCSIVYIQYSERYLVTDDLLVLPAVYTQVMQNQDVNPGQQR